MNKQEAYNILALLQANYPDSLRGMTKEAVQVKVNLWADIFAEEPFELVAAATKAFMATDTNRFMPAVGQIKEQIRRLQNPDELTEQEAWNLISKALGNGIYGSTEEFAKLPPAVQKLVGSPTALREWALLDTVTAQSVVASNFQRSYRATEAQEKDRAKLPGSVKQFISGVSEMLRLED